MKRPRPRPRPNSRPAKARPVFSSTGPDKFKTCPVCAEKVQKRAKLCRYCGEPLTIAGRLAGEREIQRDHRARYQEKTNNVTKAVAGLGCALPIMIFCLVMAFSGGGDSKSNPVSDPNAQWMTVNGYDSTLNITNQNLALWDQVPRSRQRHRRIGSVHHMSKVKYIRSDGEFSLVETQFGRRGWLHTSWLRSNR